uniref:Uncharacterized protein n=1 Tax=Siphoviridae sp. ctnN38 TaxID=2826455 RepID=A0A8S5N649_9CAUD|nr:MAG TPA: protein of unknown function (DUF5637) [Siphoviridae sp. ctnN38]
MVTVIQFCIFFPFNCCHCCTCCWINVSFTVSICHKRFISFP